MSRTMLCVLTAGVLASVSLGTSLVRRHVLGEETRVPHDPGTYRVALHVSAQSTGDARLMTACPLDFGGQHVFGEETSSDTLSAKAIESRHGERRHIQWSLRPGAARGPVQASYEFYCSVGVRRGNSSMGRLNKLLHAPPKPGEDLAASPGIDPSDAEITELALELTAGLETKVDKARALFHFVAEEIRAEPRGSQSAGECLTSGRGDALGRTRLVVALCRNRGIPARLVTGILLAKSGAQKAHTWVEAWVGDYWMSMCPAHHHCGRVPATYLIFGYGDMLMVRAKRVRDLDYAFVVEPTAQAARASDEASPLRAFFARVSLHSLPPAEGRLVEFLLLLPVAALIICVFRNLIGLESFGTFAPALIGLAFRELASLPGILVFLSIVLVGWLMRRVMDRYHLLQVPRTAFMLSLVVVMLIALIVAANYRDVAATRYISLFPLVILTGMIERFWTLETEDGAWCSFKTLVATLVIAATISLVVGIPVLVRHLVNYPETIGLVMACQLLIGRYTGYRLLELYRFRDFLRQPEVNATEEPS